MTNSTNISAHLYELGGIRVAALYDVRPEPIHIVLDEHLTIFATHEVAAELATKLNAFLAANKLANTIAALAEGGMK